MWIVTSELIINIVHKTGVRQNFFKDNLQRMWFFITLQIENIMQREIAPFFNM